MPCSNIILVQVNTLPVLLYSYHPYVVVLMVCTPPPIQTGLLQHRILTHSFGFPTSASNMAWHSIYGEERLYLVPNVSYRRVHTLSPTANVPFSRVSLWELRCRHPPNISMQLSRRHQIVASSGDIRYHLSLPFSMIALDTIEPHYHVNRAITLQLNYLSGSLFTHNMKMPR